MMVSICLCCRWFQRTFDAAGAFTSRNPLRLAPSCKNKKLYILNDIFKRAHIKMTLKNIPFSRSLTLFIKSKRINLRNCINTFIFKYHWNSYRQKFRDSGRVTWIYMYLNIICFHWNENISLWKNCLNGQQSRVKLIYNQCGYFIHNWSSLLICAYFGAFIRNIYRQRTHDKLC